MSNGNLEIKAISAHTGGIPGGGEYPQPDGATHIGASAITMFAS